MQFGSCERKGSWLKAKFKKPLGFALALALSFGAIAPQAALASSSGQGTGCQLTLADVPEKEGSEYTKPYIPGSNITYKVTLADTLETATEDVTCTISLPDKTYLKEAVTLDGATISYKASDSDVSDGVSVDKKIDTIVVSLDSNLEKGANKSFDIKAQVAPESRGTEASAGTLTAMAKVAFTTTSGSHFNTVTDKSEIIAYDKSLAPGGNVKCNGTQNGHTLELNADASSPENTKGDCQHPEHSQWKCSVCSNNFGTQHFVGDFAAHSFNGEECTVCHAIDPSREDVEGLGESETEAVITASPSYWANVKQNDTLWLTVYLENVGKVNLRDVSLKLASLPEGIALDDSKSLLVSSYSWYSSTGVSASSKDFALSIDSLFSKDNLSDLGLSSYETQNDYNHGWLRVKVPLKVVGPTEGGTIDFVAEGINEAVVSEASVPVTVAGDGYTGSAATHAHTYPDEATEHVKLPTAFAEGLDRYECTDPDCDSSIFKSVPKLSETEVPNTDILHDTSTVPVLALDVDPVRSTAYPGEDVTLHVSASNGSDVIANNLELKARSLSDGVKIEDASDPVAIASLSSNAPVTHDFVVHVDKGATTELKNLQFELAPKDAAGEGEAVANSVAAPAGLNVIARPEAALAVTMEPGTFDMHFGDPAKEFTVLVTNSVADSETGSASLTIDVPAGLTIDGKPSVSDEHVMSSAGVVDVSGGKITVTWADGIAYGDRPVITFKVTPAADGANDFVMKASATAEHAQGGESQASVHVTPAPSELVDPTLTLSVDKSEVENAEEGVPFDLVYTLSNLVEDSSSTGDVTFTANIPEGVSVSGGAKAVEVTGDEGASASLNDDGTTLTVGLSEIAYATQVTITVPYELEEGASGDSFIISAQATPESGSASSIVSTTVTKNEFVAPALSLSVDPIQVSEARPGEAFNVLYTLRNMVADSSSTGNVTLTVNIPEGLTLVGGAEGVIVNTDDSATKMLSADGRTLTIVLSGIAAEGQVVLNVPFAVGETTGEGAYAISASATALVGTSPDAVTTTVGVVTPAPDDPDDPPVDAKVLTLEVAPATVPGVLAGSSVELTANLTSTEAGPVTLDVTLPEGYALDGEGPSAIAVTGATVLGVETTDTGFAISLDVTGTDPVELVFGVLVPEDVELGDATIGFTATSEGAEDVTASTLLTVVEAPVSAFDLIVTPSSGKFALGASATFTFEVMNTGAAYDGPVQVNFAIPDGFRVSSISVPELPEGVTGEPMADGNGFVFSSLPEGADVSGSFVVTNADDLVVTNEQTGAIGVSLTSAEGTELTPTRQANVTVYRQQTADGPTDPTNPSVEKKPDADLPQTGVMATTLALASAGAIALGAYTRKKANEKDDQD